MAPYAPYPSAKVTNGGGFGAVSNNKTPSPFSFGGGTSGSAVDTGSNKFGGGVASATSSSSEAAAVPPINRSKQPGGNHSTWLLFGPEKGLPGSPKKRTQG